MVVCAFCEDTIVGKAIAKGGHQFCSPECVEAYDSYDDDDEDEDDDEDDDDLDDDDDDYDYDEEDEEESEEEDNKY